MPLRLVPPGSRKGNRFWYVRGTVAGKRVEVSTNASDQISAARFKAGFEQRLLERDPPGIGEIVTFRRAVLAYRGYRAPAADEGTGDGECLDRLVEILGPRPIGEIVHADLVAAANALKPGTSSATRNREVLGPAAAVLHYAAANGWCPWLRVKLFKVPKPRTRAVDVETARRLIGATDGMKRLLLVWLFRQGHRISDALAIECARIDLSRATVERWHGKQKEWLVDPLHPDVVALLATVGDLARAAGEVGDPGFRRYLFPWRTKSGVYKWLGPLASKLKIKFTPHMARHSLGTWLNAQGAGLRTIMRALGHADPKSSIRYQDADVEIVRDASARLAALDPIAPAKPKSAERPIRARRRA